MKNNNIAYILLGVAAFMYISKRNNPRQTYVPQQTYIPPRPSNAQAFANWAAAIMSVYGNVSELWQPGGPFYQFPTDEIYDAVDQSQNSTYDNPYLDDQGMWT